MAAFSKLSAHLTPGKLSISAVGVALLWTVYRKAYALGSQRKPSEKVAIVIAEQRKKDKAHVDALFFRRLLRILKILIPGWFTPEAWYIILVAAMLATRTFCDVWMIQNSTSIESAIIGRSIPDFKSHIAKFILAMPAISLVNNTLKYGLNELKLRFRTRLTTHLYKEYLRGFTYYKMSNLDNRVSNADHLLTQDVEKLCNSVGELYSNLSKPLLDIVIFATKLTTVIGIQGPAWMIAYLIFSGLILTRVRRPIGKLTIQEQRLEGDYRYVNSRLITNCEEIAFYQGNKKEAATITSAFERLVEHLRHFIFFRLQMGLVDNIIAKYCATVVGFTVVSRPFLNLANERIDHLSQSEKIQEYYQSGRMLVRMAEAIGRVVLAGRELTRLAGFVARITEFMDVLDDLNLGRYTRTMVREDQDKSANKSTLKPGSGTVLKKDHIIKFEHVPLITPNGDILVNELNFEVKSGVNVLVCGPNGCGKSSLFRILGELWPLFGGTLTKPDSKELFYVPQRPYMTMGTLRDQVIYPHNRQEQLKKGFTDKDLEQIVSKVQLEYILEREGDWESVQDWMDVLSGGEKQRMAMARLLYHKPQFAILDECTSAVSVDVEGYMYQYCREIGITLFTVSHRKSLWKHHEYYLYMDGRGTFDFKKITSDTDVFGS